jgi:hypothetical protein
MSGRRTFSRAKKQRGRTKTPGQIFLRLQQDTSAPRPDFVHEFVRWFAALHTADPRAVYHYLLAPPRGHWFVAIDQQPDGALGAAVCANPLAWNAERNRGDAPLRILRGVHGPYDRRTAGLMCAKIQQKTLNA